MTTKFLVSGLPLLACCLALSAPAGGAVISNFDTGLSGWTVNTTLGGMAELLSTPIVSGQPFGNGLVLHIHAGAGESPLLERTFQVSQAGQTLQFLAASTFTASSLPEPVRATVFGVDVAFPPNQATVLGSNAYQLSLGPAGTYKIVLSVYAGTDAAAAAEGYFDDLTTAPEPGAISLLIVGAAVVLRSRKRRSLQ